MSPDYPLRVRLTLITESVHRARHTEQPMYDRTIGTPCLGLLRPGTYGLVDDDTPVTCTLCGVDVIPNET